MNNATNSAASNWAVKNVTEHYINEWRSHVLTRNPILDGATLDNVEDALVYKFRDGSTITLTASQAGGWEAFVNSNAIAG